MLDILFESLVLLPTFALGVFTVALIYWYSTRNHDYFEKLGIPYVKPLPFVGSVLQNILKPLHVLDKIRHETFGLIYGHFEGNRALLSVADPKLLRDILVKDFQFFSGRRVFTFGDEVSDSFLSSLQGEDWKRVRTIVTPTFTTGKIRKVTDIFRDCSKTLMHNFKQACQNGEDIEVKRVYGAFSMDVIASSSFSTKVDSHNDPDNRFAREARKIFTRNINWRILMWLITPSLMKSLKVSIFDPGALSFFRKATVQIIEERQKTGQTRNDFLQLLLDTAKEEGKKLDMPETNKETDLLNNYGEEPSTDHSVFKNAFAVKKTLSLNELIAQCVIFFIAGYDTTASTMSFCTYNLALNPDIQEKVTEEVDSVIREHQGELTYEAVQQMKYLDNFISETLRVFPPGVRLERIADADYKLGDTGITIPKGMLITIPVYAIHRDPTYFPDPEKFDPDRFNSEEKGKRDQFAFMPFGAGPRNCVAMRFALMEVKVCLAHVIATFKIKRSPNTKVPLDFFTGIGILQPKEITVKMEIREDSPLTK